MLIQMKHLKQNKTGIYCFRRRVPSELQSVIGKKEFKASLGTRDEAEAIRLLQNHINDSDLEITRAKQRLSIGRSTKLSFHQAEVIAQKWLQTTIQELNESGLPEDYQGWLVSIAGEWETFDSIGLLDPSHLTDRAHKKLPAYIDQALASHGIAFTSRDAEYSCLLEAFNLATIQLSHYCHARIHRKNYSVDTPLAGQELNLTGNRFKLSEIFEKYESEMLLAKAVSSVTIKETQSQLTDFIGEYGDKDIRTVTRELIADYRALLLKQPASKTKAIRKLSLKERANLAAANNMALLAPGTVKNKLKKLGPIFTYAMHKGLIDNNPFTGQTKILKKAKNSSKNREYSPHDLEVLFSQPLFKVGPSEDLKQRFGMAPYWFPIIAYYTGARREEICQLRMEDFEFDGEFPYIMIHDEHEEQSVKTDSSNRRVPIHPALLSMGLADYAQNSNGFIFPKLKTNSAKMGNSIGKWLGTFVRELGIEINQPSHGLRHTFIGLCRECGIHPENQKWITGHDKQEISRQYGSESISMLSYEIRKIIPLFLAKLP